MANHCEECGFDWETSLIDEIRVIGQFPDRVRQLVEGAADTLYERPAPEIWSPNEYVWHMVDAFRQFAEWLHMTRTLDHPTHTTFNGDQMAELRSYADRPAEIDLYFIEHFN